MTKYIHLQDMLFNQPHLCTPQYAETVLSVVGDKFGVDTSAFGVDGEQKENRSPNMVGDPYVMPIIGSMVHRGGSLDALSGIQSYQSIQSELQEAIDNPAVKQVVLDIDSPGGSVAGAFDLKDFISEAKEKKPIYAMARDSMCSAAYLIGSAATEVYATQTAQVGSIGVVAMHMDQSEANKKQGVKPTFIYAGDYKTAGNPHEKLEGDALEYLKESVEDAYQMFVSAVAENRGLDEQAIRDTEARVYRGEKAVEIGLVDGIKSYDTLLEELANNSQQRVYSYQSIKGDNMTKESEKLEADTAQISAEVDALKAENEGLRKALIENGFKITKDGVEAPEATQEAPKETLEVNGKTVDLSAMPEEAAAALKDMVAAQEDSALEAKAKEMFPHMDIAAAKELASVDLSEEAMSALKAADALMAEQFEEAGESAKQGDMTDPTEKLNGMITDYMEEHKVNEAKATAAVMETAEGRKAYNDSKKGA